ncbi:DEAD/DEAH box helicase [Candidatus Woesearchaeota archaeon]|nr:DEAD/DEAH box helicase [Candidatus Woesearchaeota archaeon]
MKQFYELGISNNILRTIEEENFEEPTEIQEKSIPLILEGKDVIGGSKTGSGKTLAFSTAIIQNSEKGKGIQALVLTPTRELAEQVSKELKKFSKYKKLSITPIYGGVSINPQIEKLCRTDVVVGTPGRILDHLSRNTINLSKVRTLVLDEADRMLDMGFLNDVEKIIRKCSVKRQTLLFSATISTDIYHLAGKYMNSPVKISAENYVDPKLMKQVYFDVKNKLKFSLLVHLLKLEHPGLVMVFCNTRKSVDFVSRNLKKNNIDAIAIHGGFSQAKRTQTMNQFYKQDIYVLVCTDVAARGLDIKGVSHVYNFDIPKDSKDYIHRIGRTARAGNEGKVINLLSERDHENFSRVLRDNDLNIEKKQTPYIERVVIAFQERNNKFNNSRRFGKRPRTRRTHY